MSNITAHIHEAKDSWLLKLANHIFLKVLLKQNITYLKHKLPPFPWKGFFRSEGKRCLQLYIPGILGGASDVLCTC